MTSQVFEPVDVIYISIKVFFFPDNSLTFSFAVFLGFRVRRKGSVLTAHSTDVLPRQELRTHRIYSVA